MTKCLNKEMTNKNISFFLYNVDLLTFDSCHCGVIKNIYQLNK